MSFQHDDFLRGLVKVVAQPFAFPEKTSDLSFQRLLTLIHNVDLKLAMRGGGEKTLKSPAVSVSREK